MLVKYVTTKLVKIFETESIKFDSELCYFQIFLESQPTLLASCINEIEINGKIYNIKRERDEIFTEIARVEKSIVIDTRDDYLCSLLIK